MSSLWAATRGSGSISVSLVMPMSKGANCGGRVVACGFGGGATHPSYRRGGTRITVEIDGRQWQDESSVRRQCARIAVPFAMRAARLIRAGAVEPVAERQPKPSTWAHVVFFLVETTAEGWDRTARVNYQFAFEDRYGEPEVGELDGELAAASLERFSKVLHGSIDEPENSLVFGRAA